MAAAVYTQRKFPLCVASSMIAALLLQGGRNAHSHFKLLIPADDTSRCNIKKGDKIHDILKLTKLIIWDEATCGSHISLPIRGGNMSMFPG